MLKLDIVVGNIVYCVYRLSVQIITTEFQLDWLLLFHVELMCLLRLCASINTEACEIECTAEFCWS